MKLSDTKQLHTLRIELDNVLKKLTPLSSVPTVYDTPETTDDLKMVKLIEKLEPMLKNFDTECFDMLDEIRRIPDMGELADCVEVFDFKGALAELKKIKKKAGF